VLLAHLRPGTSPVMPPPDLWHHQPHVLHRGLQRRDELRVEPPIQRRVPLVSATISRAVLPAADIVCQEFKLGPVSKRRRKSGAASALSASQRVDRPSVPPCPGHSPARRSRSLQSVPPACTMDFSRNRLRWTGACTGTCGCAADTRDRSAGWPARTGTMRMVQS
jgi:hypothetical protein